MTQERLTVWSPETGVPGTLLGEGPPGLRMLGVETQHPLEGDRLLLRAGVHSPDTGAPLDPSIVPQAGGPVGWQTASAVTWAVLRACPRTPGGRAGPVAREVSGSRPASPHSRPDPSPGHLTFPRGSCGPAPPPPSSTPGLARSPPCCEVETLQKLQGMGCRRLSNLRVPRPRPSASRLQHLAVNARPPPGGR